MALRIIATFLWYHISQNSTLNLAYWNLHERNLTKVQNNFYVKNKKMTCFHFSGYEPKNPSILSKHAQIELIKIKF